MEDRVVFRLDRLVATDDTTMGVLLDASDFRIGYTLEDTLRPKGIKVYGETAIPEGLYKLNVSYSPRFGKEMVEVLDVPYFTGVRIHGGNTAADTLGCPLLGAKTDMKSKVWQCALVNSNFVQTVRRVLASKAEPYLDVSNKNVKVAE